MGVPGLIPERARGSLLAALRGGQVEGSQDRLATRGEAAAPAPASGEGGEEAALALAPGSETAMLEAPAPGERREEAMLLLPRQHAAAPRTSQGPPHKAEPRAGADPFRSVRTRQVQRNLVPAP